MTIFGWLTGRFSNRGRSLLLFERGMARANKHDHAGAITDYTTAIDRSETSADVRARALYNRALAHFAAGDTSKGVDDINQVLAMGAAHSNVKTMARQKLACMEAQSQKRNSSTARVVAR